MLAALRSAALEVYGVPASALRVFFHYQPQFYRLHAHATRVEFACPGSEVRAAEVSQIRELRPAHDRAPPLERPSLSSRPTCQVERAHLLSDVAGLLALDGEFFHKAALVYTVRDGEALHTLLADHGALAVPEPAAGGSTVNMAGAVAGDGEGGVS